MEAHAKTAAPNKGYPNIPNKNRRTDERTPQQVAETNATLQMFTSHRKSSWMNGLSPAAVGEGATGDMGPASRGDSPARGKNNTPAQPLHQNTSPSSSAQGVDGGPGASKRPHGLVDYESPIDVRASTPATSVAPSNANMQPGLPSPAPSDRNADSPILVTDDDMSHNHNQSGKRPRGRPPKNPVSSVPNALQMSIGPKRPRGRPRKEALDSANSNATPAQSPLTTTVSNTSAAPSPLLPSHVVVPGSQSHVQTSQSFTGLYNTLRMREMMEDFSSSPGIVLNDYDCGRKALLTEAINKRDLFYLVLSQMFCLHSCEPSRLPNQLGKVPPSSWAVLENLLCANQALTPRVLKWMSEFPAPVYFTYASNESSSLVNELVVIERFLQELPRRWDRLMATSQQRLAPPLSEDMGAELYLTSPVLQTTIFRAVARSFWGASDNKGAQILESLHRVDQETCDLRHWRRTNAERQTAYDIYARLFVAWKRWCDEGNPPDSFVAPTECNYFQQPPQSMSRLMAVDSNVAENRTAIAEQQRRLIETNDRMLAQQYQAPDGHTAARQRQDLGRHNCPGSQSHTRTPNLIQGQHSQHLHQNQQIYRSPTLPSNAPLLQQAPLSASHAPTHLHRFFPPENAPPRPQPVHPDTSRVALHQAHLRSPTPGPKKLEPGAQLLYRHVTAYVLSPSSLDGSYAQSMPFTLSEAQIDKIPAIKPSNLPGEPGTRFLNEESALYRLRCSVVPPNLGFQTESSWVTAENVWPEVLLFQINGHYLESRKKLHHGRYLPIDVSPYLHPGENVLKVYTLPGSQDRRQYAIAVEMIGVTSHDSIVSKIPLISSAESLAAIKRSLAASSDDDDEITMTSSTITIPLFDPYRADRICNTPVRGTACLHRDCFDLETFLSQCKRDEPGYASSPDSWRCPICKGDVRPQTLIKDGFLMEVREKLEQQGALNTRAIIVEADGSWKPKEEPQPTGVRSPSLEREEGLSGKAETGEDQGPAKGKQKVVEVIELD